MMRGYEIELVLELIQASRDNNQQRLDELCSDPKVIKSVGSALIDAACDAKVDILRDLLSIEQIMKMAHKFSNQLVMAAIRNNHPLVIKYLVMIPDIIKNVTDDEMLVVTAALEENEREVLDALRQVQVFNDHYLYFQFIEAAREGNFPLLNHLLEYSFVYYHAAAFNNEALQCAFDEGKTKIVQRLLEVYTVVQNLTPELLSGFCEHSDEAKRSDIVIFQHLLKVEEVQQFLRGNIEAYQQLLHKLLASIDKRNPALLLEHNEGQIIARRRILLPSVLESDVIDTMNKIAQDHHIDVATMLSSSEMETFLSYLPQGLGIFDNSDDDSILDFPVLSFTRKREKPEKPQKKISVEACYPLPERSDSSSDESTKRVRRR
jgi:hypothetical protein